MCIRDRPSNAKELFANPDVDGGLIGGAALKVSDFKGIIDADVYKRQVSSSSKK